MILSASGVYFGNAGPIQAKLTLSRALGAEEAIIAMTPIHKDEPERQDRKNCSSENWVCKKKRMLKQMLKEALNKPTLTKALEDACPPGVWTCSTGKR